MKRITSVLAILALTIGMVQARPMPIRFSQLPEVVQAYAKQYFPLGDNDYRNAYVTYDEEMPEAAYTIVFTVGDGLEFRSNNELKVYECHSKGVPATILPEAVAQAVQAGHPNTRIDKFEVVRISLTALTYEITLADGSFTTYDEAGQVVE